MRQVNIRTLYKQLSKELKDLPFEIMSGKKLIAVVSMPECLDIKPKVMKSVKDSVHEAKEKLTAIIEKKQSTDKPKAHSSTGVGLFNPCPKPGGK